MIFRRKATSAAGGAVKQLTTTTAIALLALTGCAENSVDAEAHDTTPVSTLEVPASNTQITEPVTVDTDVQPSIDLPVFSTEKFAPEVIEEGLENDASIEELRELQEAHEIAEIERRVQELNEQREQERLEEERKAQEEAERKAAEEEAQRQAEAAAEEEAQANSGSNNGSGSSSGGSSSNGGNSNSGGSSSNSGSSGTAEDAAPISLEGKSNQQIADEVAARHGCGDFQIVFRNQDQSGNIVWYEGGAPKIEPYIYLRNDMDAYQTAYVTAHECAHIRQWQAYDGHVEELYDDANAVYGALRADYPRNVPGKWHGLEQNADCIAQSWGYRTGGYAYYTTNCDGARGTAADQISNGNRIG
ncbi:hypothetical protein [Nesterenkonia alba]|uniref:hypothetical protein n=1 Tax=Nesterenkonia alba TaxID=515814 RepID=UPI0003B796EA|nr:hypothetical protein [Nesterenkonia alba]